MAGRGPGAAHAVELTRERIRRRGGPPCPLRHQKQRLPLLVEGRDGEPRDPVEQARNICLRLLTGSPRTRKQLADALRKREIPDEAAEEVLARFVDVGLIDDAAFAGAWVESRHHGRGSRAAHSSVSCGRRAWTPP